MSKKLIALVLAFALVFSTFTAAFAAEAIPADAQIAKDLGMLVGGGNGVTIDYLKTTPTRIQAAVMFLRLKGLEDAAKAFTGTANFADANDAAWAKPIMAYLKANPELGWAGVGNNKFDPNAQIDAKQYYKVMLEALGYKQNTTEVIGDFTWANVLTFAASKGLSKVANVSTFVVNDIASATIEALKANVKGSTKTLAVSLVEAKAINEEAAVKAGLYVKAAVAPVVASVTATNNKQITVVFSKEVDKATAETAANYVIATNGAAVVGSAKLQSDNKTVVITLSTAANQQESITLTVKNVKDVAGTAMVAVEKQVSFLDVTIPVAQRIELVGPQQFRIVFSEPVDTNVAGSVLVENGIYGASVASITGNTVVVNLGSTLADGSYKVKVAGYKDYVGYQMAAAELTLNYAKDVTPVTVSVDKATQEYVIVKFNKAVRGSDLTTTTFYHTFTAWNPTTVTQEDGSAIVGGNFYEKARLNFDTFKIPAGTASLVVKKADGSNAIQDQWANKMASDVTLAVTVTADTVAPTVVKAEATAENTFEITFSEELTAGVGTGANLAANYVVKNAAGTVVTPATVVYSFAQNVSKTTITFSPALAGGNYTVEVKDVTDRALAANKIATVTVNVTVTDKTAPAISNAVVVENTADTTAEFIYITFSEAMATTGAGSILDLNNYQLDGAAMPEGSKVELFGSNTRVKITVPAQTTTLIGATRLIIGRVADIAGNRIVALATPVTIANDVAPSTATVKTLGLNRIMITINGLLTEVPADGIAVTNNGVTHTLAAVSFTKDATKTYITGTLNANNAISGPAAKPTSVTVVADKLVTETGKKLGEIVVLQAAIADGIAPAYASIAQGAANSYNFVVSYDENLVEIASSLTATEFVLVDKDGKTLTANVDYTTSVSGANITFQLIGAKYATYTGKMTVSTKSVVTYFGDGSGTFVPGTNNAAGIFAAKEVTVR